MGSGPTSPVIALPDLDIGADQFLGPTASRVARVFRKLRLAHHSYCRTHATSLHAPSSLTVCHWDSTWMSLILRLFACDDIFLSYKLEYA